jgi:hypothetical protein
MRIEIVREKRFSCAPKQAVDVETCASCSQATACGSSGSPATERLKNTLTFTMPKLTMNYIKTQFA